MFTTRINVRILINALIQVAYNNANTLLGMLNVYRNFIASIIILYTHEKKSGDIVMTNK